MDIQDFILEHWKPLVLIAGLLMLFLGIMPIVSQNYYEKFHESKWDDKFWPFSQDDKRIYGRYIQQINIILIGLTLVGIVIYKILYP